MITYSTVYIYITKTVSHYLSTNDTCSKYLNRLFGLDSAALLLCNY